jgi:hypothetical protein
MAVIPVAVAVAAALVTAWTPVLVATAAMVQLQTFLVHL